jgi:FkbM family methyltransferase
VNLNAVPKSPRELHPPQLIHPVWAREVSSDLAVFTQIFEEGEYACIDGLTDVGLIVDCGANVGYYSAYCLSRFADCEVLAIEPDAGNFAMLERNLSPYGNRARLVHGGVWSHSVRLAISEGAYRDGREWTKQVRECRPDDKADFQGMDIATLLEKSGHHRISILKIDVEGAEAVIFSANYQSWIDKVDAIVIELHDDSHFGNASRIFDSAIQGRGFHVSRCGQITVCTSATACLNGARRSHAA